MSRAARSVGAVLCLCVTACSESGAGPAPGEGSLRSLVELSGHRTGLGMVFAAVGERHTIGVPSLCAPAPGEVTSVTLEDARGLRLVDVGLRVESEAKDTIGSDARSPAALGFHPLPLRYSAPCPHGDEVPRTLQVVMSVAPTGTGAASASGVRVGYTEDGSARSRVIDFPLTACVTTAEQCPQPTP